MDRRVKERRVARQINTNKREPDRMADPLRPQPPNCQPVRGCALFPASLSKRLTRLGWAALMGACLLSPGASKAALASTNTTAVTAVQNPAATSTYVANPDVVRTMVERGLLAFTAKPTLREAWASLVSSNDVIGIKVFSAPGPLSGTRPAVVEAVVQTLIASGHSPSKIVLWDKRRYELRGAGWPEIADRLGIRCIAAAEAGWEASKFYENPLLGRPLFDELEYDKKADGVGRRSHLTRLLTRDVTRIISIAPSLNHNHAGVSGHVLGLAYGAFDNTLRFENNPDRISETVPELLATPELIDHLALCITDALICQYRGEDRTLLHYTVALNELRFSRDPIALDALTLVDIENARKSNPTDTEKPFKSELYNNTELLELGVADPKRIQVTRVP